MPAGQPVKLDSITYWRSETSLAAVQVNLNNGHQSPILGADNLKKSLHCFARETVQFDIANNIDAIEGSRSGWSAKLTKLIFRHGNGTEAGKIWLNDTGETDTIKLASGERIVGLYGNYSGLFGGETIIGLGVLV